jgi:hypothetical protein
MIRKAKNTFAAKAKGITKSLGISHPTGVLLSSVVWYAYWRPIKSTNPKR